MPFPRMKRALVVLAAAAAVTAGVASPAFAAPPPTFDPAPPALTEDGVLLNAPDPGAKRYAPETDLKNHPKGEGAAQPAPAGRERVADHTDDVVVTSTEGEIVTVTIYSPAEGVTPEELVKRLQDGGLNARIERHDAETSGVVAARAPNSCTIGTARAAGSGDPNLCPPPLHHTNNGYSDPQVRFNDHSSSLWPVNAGVSHWNTAVGIDSYYLWNSCPFQAGARCVGVFSDDYGNTGYRGYTSYSYNGTTHAFTENSMVITLNEWNIGGLSAAARAKVARHELGHAVGLGHALATSSVMWDPAANGSTGGNANDFQLLESIYSINR